MPTCRRFEELSFRRKAADLYDRVDDFIDRALPRLPHSFRDQIERAALSISNNIAAEARQRGSGEPAAFQFPPPIEPDSHSRTPSRNQSARRRNPTRNTVSRTPASLTPLHLATH